MTEPRIPDPDDADVTRRTPPVTPRRADAAEDDAATIFTPRASPPDRDDDRTMRRPQPRNDREVGADGAEEATLIRPGSAGRKAPPSRSEDDTVQSGDPLIGKTLGGCRVEAVIGAGGMGTVYRARQVSLDRIVAVKTIRPEFATDAESLERFRREAKAVGKFKTPHVVQIYQVGHELGVPFIVLEFVPGGSLREFAEQQPNGRVSSDDAIRFLREAALGLRDAAEKGIVHRDIKPDNMLLDERGTLKIADFGISKVVQQDVSMTLTMGGIVGTPLYMSPEQCRGDTIDFRSDMWSLGATFFFLLTGNPPAKGSSLLELIRTKNEVLNLDPSKILPREIPGSLSEVIRRLTMLKREDRYPTYDELLADLDIVAAGRRPKRRLSGAFVRWTLAVAVIGSVGAVSAANWEQLRGAVKSMFERAPEPSPKPVDGTGGDPVAPVVDLGGMRRELDSVGEAVPAAADEAALTALANRVNAVRDQLAVVPKSTEADELRQSVGALSSDIGTRIQAMQAVEQVKGFRDRLTALTTRADAEGADLPTIRSELRTLIDAIPNGGSWDEFRSEASGALRSVIERHYRKRLDDAESAFVKSGPRSASALTAELVGNLANESTGGTFVEIGQQATGLDHDVRLAIDVERELQTRPTVKAPFEDVDRWVKALAKSIATASDNAKTEAFASWVGPASERDLTDDKLRADVVAELQRVWGECQQAVAADDVRTVAARVQDIRDCRSNLAELRGFEFASVITDAAFEETAQWLKTRSATDQVVEQIDAAIAKARATGSLRRWLSVRASAKAERDDLAGRALREELAGDDRLPKAVAQLDAEIAVWTSLEERVRGALDAVGKAGLDAATKALEFGDITDRDVAAIAEIAVARAATTKLGDGFRKLFGSLDTEGARKDFNDARTQFDGLPEGLGGAEASKYSKAVWERARVLADTVRDGGMVAVTAGRVEIATTGRKELDNTFDVEAFYLDRTEVDRITFKGVIDAGGLRNVSGTELNALKRVDWSRPRLPMTGVSRVAAIDCLKWLGGRTLPKHREWWLATKGPGANRGFPWGDRWEPGLIASTTVPENVDTDRAPTRLGDIDVHYLVGNAAEWLADELANGSGGALAGGGIGDSLQDLRDRAVGKVAFAPPTVPPGNAGFRGVIRPREFFGPLAPIE